MRQKIMRGLTNVSYKEGNIFIQELKRNSFNHIIDYSLLSKFNFVPKLLEHAHDITKWEFIEGHDLLKDDSTLKKVAKILNTVHKSNLQFPSFNHRDRVNTYRKQLKEKGLIIPVVNDYFRRINIILSKMDKTTPVHNDLFWFNFIIDNKKKVWLVDWEYASMGDKHFDLAYFIESFQLTDQQENVFLDAYEKYDYEKLIQQKILVNYFVVLWVNVQPTKYFDDQPYIDRIIELDKFLVEYRKKLALDKFNKY